MKARMFLTTVAIAVACSDGSNTVGPIKPPPVVIITPVDTLSTGFVIRVITPGDSTLCGAGNWTASKSNNAAGLVTQHTCPSTSEVVTSGVFVDAVSFRDTAVVAMGAPSTTDTTAQGVVVQIDGRTRAIVSVPMWPYVLLTRTSPAGIRLVSPAPGSGSDQAAAGLITLRFGLCKTRKGSADTTTVSAGIGVFPSVGTQKVKKFERSCT